MTGILGALLVLACLIGVYALLLGGIGGRRGRPPAGVLTRLRDPSKAPIAVAAMSGFALGTMSALTDSHADSSSGVMIGLLLAITLAIPGIGHLTLAACGLVGTIVAFWQLGIFLVGDGDATSAAYRGALVGLLFACFALAIVLFDRSRALRGEVGLAFFGLVDVMTFLAQPGNRSTLSLDGVSHLAFLALVGAISFGLGWAASEYVLGVVALAVATVSFAESSVVGDARQAWIGLVAAGTAFGLTLVGRSLVARVLGR